MIEWNSCSHCAITEFAQNLCGLLMEALWYGWLTVERAPKGGIGISFQLHIGEFSNSLQRAMRLHICPDVERAKKHSYIGHC